MPQMITHSQLYNKYKDCLPLKDKISTYLDIWKTLNEALIDSTILGNTETFSRNLGYIRILRIKNRPKLNSQGLPCYPINWGKTKKLRLEGKLDSKKFAYSIQEFKCRFTHTRYPNCSLKGFRAYSFKFSRTNGTSSNTGAINKLSTYILENPVNYLRFPLKK